MDAKDFQFRTSNPRVGGSNPSGRTTSAQALRARLLNQVNEGKRPATDATVAQLLTRWLEVADLAWSTRVTYQGYINRSILPALGDLPLRRLDTAALDRFYTTLR